MVSEGLGLRLRAKMTDAAIVQKVSSVVVVVVVALATLSGCPVPRHYIECEDDTSCGRAADGRCLVNVDTSHRFCAYPDSTCPDGMRWSDLDVESSISGLCVTGAPDASVVDAIGDAGWDGSVDATVLDAAVDGPLGPDCTIAPVCAAPIDLGTIGSDDHGPPLPLPLITTYNSDGSPSWYRVTLADTGATGNKMSLVRVDFAATLNYDVRVYCASCGGKLSSIGFQAGDATMQHEVAYTRRDNTAANDSYDILIEVTRAPNVAACGPYVITVNGNVSSGAVTCN